MTTLAGESALLRSSFEQVSDRDGEFVRAIVVLDGERHEGPFMRSREAAVRGLLSSPAFLAKMVARLVPAPNVWMRRHDGSTRVAHAMLAIPVSDGRPETEALHNSACGLHLSVPRCDLEPTDEEPRCLRCEDVLKRGGPRR